MLNEKPAFAVYTADEYNELLRLVRNPYARKTFDQSVSSATTGTGLVADTHLTFPITRINTVYTFLAWLIVNSPTAADFKFGFDVPVSADVIWSAGEGSPIVLTAIQRGPFNSAITVSPDTTGADQVIRAEGQLFVGANAGTFRLKWAQNTNNASNTTVKTNSYMQLWPV